jgi:serine/threonine protein kinase
MFSKRIQYFSSLNDVLSIDVYSFGVMLYYALRKEMPFNIMQVELMEKNGLLPFIEKDKLYDDNDIIYELFTKTIAVHKLRRLTWEGIVARLNVLLNGQ